MFILKETHAFFFPLKGIVRQFKLGVETSLIQSTVINWKARQVFFYFYDTISQMRLKNFYDGFVHSK
jgi:hypothetical protein